MTELAPAILTNDISDFRKKYAELFALSHYFKKMHIDFIDDIFIHNKTVMPSDLGFLKSSPLELMAHFMCVEPQKYFEDAKNSGFKSVAFHYEAFHTDDEREQAIMAGKNLSLQVGIVINPETQLFMLARYLQKVDIIQLMGIHPGFQGRPFMQSTIARVRELRALSKTVIICVDGGVRVGIARNLAKAGADIVVAGSAILQSENAEMAIEALKADIES